MFTLANTCLTTSNLPWFMDLTFEIPMQYCSLQHQTLLLSPVISTAGYCFCFGSIPSFFLELLIHWSPVAYWAPTDLGSSSFSILSFCLFILFMRFSRQEYWSGLPFPSPVDHARNMYNIGYEMNHQSRLDAWCRMLGAGAVGWPRGMVRGERWKGGSGWGTHVHLWQILVDVWQTQYNIVK